MSVGDPPMSRRLRLAKYIHDVEAGPPVRWRRIFLMHFDNCNTEIKERRSPQLSTQRLVLRSQEAAEEGNVWLKRDCFSRS